MTTLSIRAAGPVVDMEETERLTELVLEKAQAPEVLVLSGSLPKAVKTDIYYSIITEGKKRGIQVILDSDGEPMRLGIEAGPYLIKPNRVELCATVGRDLRGEKAVRVAMEELQQRGAQRVVVTNAKGPALAFDGSRYWRIHPPAIRALNPIGSGDAFTAALVWRLLKGDDLGESCRWGAAAGAANALTPMPGDLDRRQVRKLAPQVRIERI